MSVTRYYVIEMSEIRESSPEHRFASRRVVSHPLHALSPVSSHRDQFVSKSGVRLREDGLRGDGWLWRRWLYARSVGGDFQMVRCGGAEAGTRGAFVATDCANCANRASTPSSVHAYDTIDISHIYFYAAFTLLLMLFAMNISPSPLRDKSL